MNNPTVQNNPGLKTAFNNLWEGSKPVENTWGNTVARRYAEFESVKRFLRRKEAV